MESPISIPYLKCVQPIPKKVTSRTLHNIRKFHTFSKELKWGFIEGKWISASVTQMGLETQIWYSTGSPEEMHKKGGEHLAHYTQLLKYFNGKLVLPLGPHIILATSILYPEPRMQNQKYTQRTNFWPSLGSFGIFHLEIKILLRKGDSHYWVAWNNI